MGTALLTFGVWHTHMKDHLEIEIDSVKVGMYMNT
jgi:hypothetical protein